MSNQLASSLAEAAINADELGPKICEPAGGSRDSVKYTCGGELTDVLPESRRRGRVLLAPNFLIVQVVLAFQVRNGEIVLDLNNQLKTEFQKPSVLKDLTDALETAYGTQPWFTALKTLGNLEALPDEASSYQDSSGTQNTDGGGQNTGAGGQNTGGGQEDTGGGGQEDTGGSSDGGSSSSGGGPVASGSTTGDDDDEGSAGGGSADDGGGGGAAVGAGVGAGLVILGVFLGIKYQKTKARNQQNMQRQAMLDNSNQQQQQGTRDLPNQTFPGLLALETDARHQQQQMAQMHQMQQQQVVGGMQVQMSPRHNSYSPRAHMNVDLHQPHQSDNPYAAAADAAGPDFVGPEAAFQSPRSVLSRMSSPRYQISPRYQSPRYQSPRQGPLTQQLGGASPRGPIVAQPNECQQQQQRRSIGGNNTRGFARDEDVEETNYGSTTAGSQQ